MARERERGREGEGGQVRTTIEARKSVVKVLYIREKL